MSNKKIIVSLTSFPPAISYATLAIKSILNGSILPDKVILYITYSQFTNTELPQELLKLADENPLFEIRNYDRDIRSYRNLIPALNDFPNDIIITIDDDVYYPKNTLRDLIQIHNCVPNAVIAHRARKIKLNMPYRKWRKYKWFHFIFKRHILDFHSLQTGVGGVLYPPHCLDRKMLNPDLFMTIAPTNDDIWFWAAAVSKGTYVVPVPGWHHKLIEIGKPREFSLKTINLKPGDDRNREAFEKILEAYPIVKQRIENEK